MHAWPACLACSLCPAEPILLKDLKQFKDSKLKGFTLFSNNLLAGGCGGCGVPSWVMQCLPLLQLSACECRLRLSAHVLGPVLSAHPHSVSVPSCLPAGPSPLPVCLPHHARLQCTTCLSLTSTSFCRKSWRWRQTRRPRAGGTEGRQGDRNEMDAAAVVLLAKQAAAGRARLVMPRASSRQFRGCKTCFGTLSVDTKEIATLSRTSNH